MEMTEKKTTEKTGPKKGTRPGWKPSSVLPNLKAKHGFTARWVRNESGNIAKKLSEGWVLMKPDDNVGIPITSFDTPDANKLATEIRYRDSIAMMLPDDVKSERDQYMRDQTRQAQKSILRDTDEKLKSAGVSTYTPKGQAGRIVIE
jgi:hypothetical protein